MFGSPDRLVVGIVGAGRGFNPCHGNVPQLLDAVKRGVMLAGGFPVEFPTISLHEIYSHPTSMFLWNLVDDETASLHAVSLLATTSDHGT